MELRTALSSAVDAPPPRLMFATAGSDVIRGHPIDAGDHTRRRARAAAAEDADCEQPDGLGDTIGRSADRSGDMRAVAVAVVRVLSVADGIEADEGAAAKLRMRPSHAGVDDVRVHPGAGRRIRIDRIEREIALADAIEPPGRVVLRDHGLDHRIFLDEGDARIVAHAERLLFGHHRREAVERVIEPMRHGARPLGHDVGDFHGVRRHIAPASRRIAVEDDDVMILNRAIALAMKSCRTGSAIRLLRRDRRQHREADKQTQPLRRRLSLISPPREQDSFANAACYEDRRGSELGHKNFV